jgi:hydrogenase nickel incorporation protein HypB
MCATCGCSDHRHATLTDLASGRQMPLGAHGHDHQHHHDHHHGDHDHDHDAAHAHAHRHGPTIAIEQAILARNDRLAERNRGWLEARGVVALNLMSAPGAGKTALLERTIRSFAAAPIGVVEGDQATLLDAERIQATGCRVVQLNTGTGCHLDAEMVAGALRQLQPPAGSVVMIENVGNLVCPALFDLGERARVVILSVTEGADKPLKYPHMFRAADLMILNKIDLLPHVDFDPERCVGYARQVSPALECLAVSARTGEGLDAWCAWLARLLATMPQPESAVRAGEASSHPATA